MTGPIPPPRRRWFRVTLRSLMILILLIGGAIGWALHTARQQREAIAAVRAAGGQITYDYQSEFILTGPGGTRSPRTEPTAPRWLRSWLGDELFQSVRTVDFGQLDSSDTLAMVGRFAQLVELHIYLIPNAGIDFGPLSGLSHLRVLSIRGPGADDAVLAEVGQIRSLVNLRLERGAATDAGIGHLVGLSNLADLTLVDNASLSDKGLTQVAAGLPSLQNFKLDTSMIRPPQRVHLTLLALATHHPDLKILVLRSTGVTDRDLPPLGKLTQLRTLSLYDSRITGAGLVHLGSLRSLIELELIGIDTDDAGLIHLAPLAALTRLNLAFTRIGDASLPALAQLPSLDILNLASTRVTTNGLSTLGSIPTLRQLDISEIDITDSAIDKFNQTYPQVRIRNSSGFAPPRPRIKPAR